MPHLPRVGAFPIAGERSFVTAAGAALKIPAKEKHSPLIGHFAPEIVAQDHLGRVVSLHATIALGRPIVLYFFPLAGSPHCTKESCSFRDAVGSSPIFNDLNAVVIGISQDPPSRSRRFVDEHDLGFRILHDEKRQTMDTYGVGRGLLGLIDSRCTFIIDHQGIIRGMLEGVWDYNGHRLFAEKWLCRIEDELSNRERFYVQHDADESAACDELTQSIKVIYGSTLPSKGIASAPRHGAAPISSPTRSKYRIYAESAALTKPKSRKNFKQWLRSDEDPIPVDFQFANQSVDTVAYEQQRRARSLALVQSLGLDAGAPRNHSRQGSGSDLATPSTVSAASHSTADTSIASPRTDPLEITADTPPPPLVSGVAAYGHSPVNMPRSFSASSSIATPTQRTSSLQNRSSEDKILHTRTSEDPILHHPRDFSNGSTRARAPAFEETASSSAATTSAQGSTVTPIFANGNIAKLQLLPGEKSGDSSVSERTASESTRAAGGPSLPAPPRPASRVHAMDAAAANSSPLASPNRRQFHTIGRPGSTSDHAQLSPSADSVSKRQHWDTFTPSPRAAAWSSSTTSTTLALLNQLELGPPPTVLERRTSLTPSLTPSNTTGVSDHTDTYSPSIVESTHTFGGNHPYHSDDDDDDNDHTRYSTDSFRF